MGKADAFPLLYGMLVECRKKKTKNGENQVGNNRENETEIDLLQLAKALWHRAWAIVLVMLITAAMAFAGTKLFITPLYTASAMMYVNNSSISVGSTQVNLSDLTAAQSLVETYTVILKTRGTLEEVIKEANLPYDYEELSKMIEAGAVNSTEVFSISVTSASPEEAEKYHGICPVCGKKLTMGVNHRIMDLADRENGFVRKNARPFESIVPLPEVISACVGKAVTTKTVTGEYEKMLQKLGNEFDILREIPIADIEKESSHMIASGIRKLRNREVICKPGFDGEYGKICLF